MKKFLSILVMVAMVLSLVQGFAPKPVAKADSSDLNVVIVYPGPGKTVNPGDCFYVNAVISNKGTTPVNTTATLTIDGPATTADGPKPIKLGDHGTTDVWWKVCCTGGGDVKLTVTAGTGTDFVIVHQTGQQIDKKLIVTWVETPCMAPFNGQVPVGTLFTVKAKLHSLFDCAEKVKVTIGYSGSLELLSAETVPVGDVCTGRDEEVAWNFKCTGEGDASVFIKDVFVFNLLQNQISLPDPCKFHQGPTIPPPPPPCR